MNTMTTDLAAKINEAHQLAIQHAGSALRHAYTAGELLKESKAALPHGKWLPWLREHIQFSERTAQAYMRLASRMPKEMRNGAADLSVRKALAYVATPKQTSMFDELRDVLVNVANREANQPDELRRCVENIHDLNGWFHKHGFCGAFDTCTVCDAEATA